MAKITATGVPEKYPEFGDLRIVVDGDFTDIENVTVEVKKNGEYVDIPEIKDMLYEDMEKGPHYPLCAEPNTMRCALFILFEWYGEEESCWTQEPNHVKLEGIIEPMPSNPGVVY